MTLLKHLIALALAFPSHADDAGEATRQTRIDTAMTALDAEVQALPSPPLPRRTIAVSALVLWQGESALSQHVHANNADKLPKNSQDRGRARCMGQVHASGLVPQPEWETLAGTDLAATRRCAAATIRVFLAQYRLCRARHPKHEDPLAMAFAGYASGRSCEVTAQAKGRAERVRARL